MQIHRAGSIAMSASRIRRADLVAPGATSIERSSNNMFLGRAFEDIDMSGTMFLLTCPQDLVRSYFSLSVILTTLSTLCKWNHMVFVFCDWLISVSLMSSTFLYVVAYVRMSLLFIAE